MTNDPKDRHVTAATIVAQAQVIVTFNVSDFEREDLEPWNVEAQHPDVNLVYLFDLWPDAMRAVFREQAADLKDFDESRLLASLAKHVPQFAQRLGWVRQEN